MRHRFLTTAIITISLALMAGCANRVSYIDKGKEVSEHRWKVEKLKYSRLTKDQRALISKKGKPDYIKFYRPFRKGAEGLLARAFRYMGDGLRNFFVNAWRPVNSHRRIEAWVYEKEDTLVWFKEGKRVDYVTVED